MREGSGVLVSWCSLALASFHVYRTYIRPKTGSMDEADRAEIGRANVSEELRRILFLQAPSQRAFYHAEFRAMVYGTLGSTTRD